MALAELLALIISLVIISPAYGWDWQDAHATFYEGSSGTQGWCALSMIMIMSQNEMLNVS